MKNFKKTILLLPFIFLGINANAQMAAAKKIEPTYIKSTTVEASIDEVWQLLKDPKLYKDYVIGVKDFSSTSSFRDATMTFSLPYDATREQSVSIINNAIQVIAFYVTKSSYQSGAWVYRLELEEKGDKTKVSYIAVTGNSDKATMIKKFKIEGADILKGIEAKF